MTLSGSESKCHLNLNFRPEMFLFREFSPQNKNFILAGVALTAGYIVYKCRFQKKMFFTFFIKIFYDLIIRNISRSRIQEAQSCWLHRSAVYLSTEIWRRYWYTICTCCRSVSDSLISIIISYSFFNKLWPWIWVSKKI